MHGTFTAALPQAQQMPTDTLLDELAAMRRQFAEAHDRELSAAQRLGAHIEEQDQALLVEVEAIIAGHEMRRARVLDAVLRLAARVGRAPAPLPLRQPIPPLPHEMGRAMPPPPPPYVPQNATARAGELANGRS